MNRRQFLTGMLASAATVALAEKVGENSAPDNSMLNFVPGRRAPWSLDNRYTSDSYPWHCRNEQPVSKLFYDGIEQPSGQESGTLDMGMEAAWQIIRNSEKPVAVIDQLGFDWRHQGIYQNVFRAEKFGGGLPDIHNHGTQVAGVIASQHNNLYGTVGICWQVPQILLQNPFTNYDAWVAATVWAFNRAVELGARVICLPQGVANHQSIKDAIIAAGAADVLVVCAALNAPSNHDNTADYPTIWKLPNVITITNCVRTGQLLQGGAGYGATTVFAGAPGRRLPVYLANDQYGFASGTSEACAVAAGLAVLLRERFRRYNVAQIRARLAAGVTPTLPGLCITGGMLHGRCLSDA